MAKSVFIVQILSHNSRYNQVVFDNDPAPHGSQDFPKEEAVLKGYSFLDKDNKPQNVLGYLVPKKRRRPEDEVPEGEEELDWIREYSYTTKPDQDNYFFVFSGEYVYYEPITHKVTVSKSKHDFKVRIISQGLQLSTSLAQWKAC
jgi:hypothetical protein